MKSKRIIEFVPLLLLSFVSVMTAAALPAPSMHGHGRSLSNPATSGHKSSEAFSLSGYSNAAQKLNSNAAEGQRQVAGSKNRSIGTAVFLSSLLNQSDTNDVLKPASIQMVPEINEVIDTIMKDPEVNAILKDPKISEIINALLKDPEIKQIANDIMNDPNRDKIINNILQDPEINQVINDILRIPETNQFGKRNPHRKQKMKNNNQEINQATNGDLYNPNGDPHRQEDPYKNGDPDRQGDRGPTNGPNANDFLRDPKIREVVRNLLRDPQISKVVNNFLNSPNSLEAINNVLRDPHTRKVINKVLQNPESQRIINSILDAPNANEIVNDILRQVL